MTKRNSIWKLSGWTDWICASVAAIILILWLVGTFCTVQADDIIIHWTAPGDDGAEGIAAAYLVYFSETAFDSVSWWSADTARFCGDPDTAGTWETCRLTGLKPATDYYVGVRTVDDAGNWSGMSNVIEKRTRDLTAPAIIVDLVAE